MQPTGKRTAACNRAAPAHHLAIAHSPHSHTTTLPLIDSSASHFATSAAGPALACIITNPADVAKTRLNLELELQKTTMSHTTGSFECMRRTYAAEGLAGIRPAP